MLNCYKRNWLDAMGKTVIRNRKEKAEKTEFISRSTYLEYSGPLACGLFKSAAGRILIY